VPANLHYYLINVAEKLQTQKYSRLAAMVIVLYDTLITMDREGCYIWSQSWSSMKAIYIINRYWGLFAIAVDTWIAVTDIRTDALCQFQLIFQSWSGLATMLLVEVIMMIRVHALYERDKWIAVLLSTVFVMQAAITATLLTALSRTLDTEVYSFMPACGTSIPMPKWFVVFWVPAVLTDMLLLALTLRRAFSYGISHGDSWKKSKLLNTIVRDQILYFVGFLLIAGANMLILMFGPKLICVALGFLLGFPVIMGCRMLLNLKEIADEKEDFDKITLTTLVFAPAADRRLSVDAESTRVEI